MNNREDAIRDYKIFVSGEQQVKAQSTLPLINEKKSPFGAISMWSPTQSGTPQTSNSPVTYDQLWEIWSNSPEAMSPCETIVTDIISDGYDVESFGDLDLEKEGKAKAFLESNQFKTRILPSILYDMLVTGDAYLYKPRLSEIQVKAAITRVAEKFPFNNPKKMGEYLYYKTVDEDTFKTKQLINVASSTITIDHDKHGNVNKYIQTVSQEDIPEFVPDEIIHFKYMNLNGKIYSFAPMKTIISELSLIASIKDNAGNMFDNGGTPSHLFIMPDEIPDSENVKMLETQLVMFKQNINKQKNLIATGNLDVKALENVTKDMQYRELLEQMTRIVYTVWGVPPSKMGQSGQDNGAYDSGLSTEGYYRRIAHLQDKIYEQLNIQLLIPEFGVTAHPRKSYLQDEQKEIQMTKQKFDIAQQGWNNNWVNKEWIIKLLEINKKYQGTFEKEEKLDSVFKQGDVKEKELNKSTPQQGIDTLKKDKIKEKGDQVKSAFTKYELEGIKQNEGM